MSQPTSFSEENLFFFLPPAYAVEVMFRRVCVYIHVCVCVCVVCVCMCLSVCLSVWATIFEAIDVETSFFGMVLHLDHI